jgi:hypothetical protein
MRLGYAYGDAPDGNGSTPTTGLSDDELARCSYGYERDTPADQAELLLALARALTIDRSEQLDLARVLLSALDRVVSELVATQDEVAHLRGRVERLDRTVVDTALLDGLAEPGDDASEGYRATRAHTLQTRRGAEDVHADAIALIKRAAELVMESEDARTRDALGDGQPP